jgi:hypothetical protein
MDGLVFICWFVLLLLLLLTGDVVVAAAYAHELPEYGLKVR